ncbi:hypothetical protein [uncultured Ruminococcus sp.]|uniref:hypothetical protein n=1 Tax=uncultured Ruminococcus sp. TaxID=165186 RepID=UPI00261D306E|nr:hypothetical protein [uncultured Ruminococcus sp.]
MTIALLNGSPKIKESASRTLLSDLKTFFPEGTKCVEIGLHSRNLPENEIELLFRADAWVFSFPLYVDGIPSHLLSILCELEEQYANHPEISVYGIVNCGFYEGIQTEFALQILQNWCVKAGYTWAGGVGVGGGGALPMLSEVKPGTGPKAPIDKTLQILADTIQSRKQTENHYVSVGMPRFLYKMAAQMGWRQMIRANGGKKKDLRNCPE